MEISLGRRNRMIRTRRIQRQTCCQESRSIRCTSRTVRDECSEGIQLTNQMEQCILRHQNQQSLGMWPVRNSLGRSQLRSHPPQWGVILEAWGARRGRREGGITKNKSKSSAVFVGERTPKEIPNNLTTKDNASDHRNLAIGEIPSIAWMRVMRYHWRREWKEIKIGHITNTNRDERDQSDLLSQEWNYINRRNHFTMAWAMKENPVMTSKT